MNIDRNDPLYNSVHRGAWDGALKGMAAGGAIVGLTDLYGLTHIALETIHRAKGGKPVAPVLAGDCQLPQFSHASSCDQKSGAKQMFTVSVLGACMVVGAISGGIFGGFKHFHND